MATARAFTALTKFYDSPTHGSVLEVELAGPASLEGSKGLTNSINESIAQHEPQCLVINLRDFELPFHDHLLGAFVGALVAMTKSGSGREFALVATGKTQAELEKLLRLTRMESVLGRGYPDVETALAEGRLPERISPPERVSPPEPPKPSDVPLPPGAWFPDLEPADKMIFAHVAALLFGGWLVAAVLRWLWNPLRGLIWIPGFLLLLYIAFEVFRVVRNCVRRVRWAWSFSRRGTARKVRKMLQEEPSRYVVHEEQYGGGFDSTKLAPATLIEDTQTNTLVAVFPPLPVL